MRTKNVVIIFILLITGIISFCWAKSITAIGSDTRNVLFNIFSSVIVILIIELIVLFRDWFKYSSLQGTYRRIKIFSVDEKKEADSKYVDMSQTYIDNKVNPEIYLGYVGDGKYQGYAFYDKGEKGKTKITLQRDLENTMIGTGTYQYFDKAIIDLGTYSFQVDLNKKTLYIFYSNLLPSGLTKGYEIWEK